MRCFLWCVAATRHRSPSLVAANKNFCQVQIRFSPASTMCMTPSIPCYHQKKCCVVAMPTQPQITKNAMPFLSRDSGILWRNRWMFLNLQTFYEIVGKIKIILRTYLLFSYPRVARSNETGLWVQPSTCSQSIPIKTLRMDALKNKTKYGFNSPNFLKFWFENKPVLAEQMQSKRSGR